MLRRLLSTLLPGPFRAVPPVHLKNDIPTSFRLPRSTNSLGSGRFGVPVPCIVGIIGNYCIVPKIWRRGQLLLHPLPMCRWMEQLLKWATGLTQVFYCTRGEF